MPITEIQDADLRALTGIHIYGVKYSNNVSRVLLMLEEKGLSFKLHSVDLTNIENLQPFFLRMHPKGTVPVLLHEGKSVSNSNDILRYLEEVFPTPALSPADQAEQEEMWRQVDAAAECHINSIKAQFYAFGAGRPCSDEALERYKKFNPALYEFHKKYRGGMSQAQKTEIFERNAALLAKLESQLGRSPYLMGPQFTVADIAWVTNVIFLDHMGYDISPYTAVCLWKEIIESRPSYNRRSRIPNVPLWLVRAVIKFGKIKKRLF